MKQEDSILQKYGKDPGFKVPENYFPDLEESIMKKLPPYVSQPAASLSTWQRIKPYLYLAAMFAGIWLMMKVFHTVTQPMSLSLDNPPDAIVQLLDHELLTGDYTSVESFIDYDIEEEVIMDYDSFEDFQKDFDSAE